MKQPAKRNRKPGSIQSLSNDLTAIAQDVKRVDLLAARVLDSSPESRAFTQGALAAAEARLAYKLRFVLEKEGFL